MCWILLVVCCYCFAVAKSCPTLQPHGICSIPGFPILHYLSEFAQIHVVESVMLSNRLILCGPLLLFRSIFPSIKVFSSESTFGIRWLKYWSFSFSLSPSNEYSGLISFRIDWFDLLAVQGTLKSILQHSSKALVLWHSAFFMVQLSHLYMTTGKTIALTMWTFVGSTTKIDKPWSAFTPKGFTKWPQDERKQCWRLLQLSWQRMHRWVSCF